MLSPRPDAVPLDPPSAPAPAAIPGLTLRGGFLFRQGQAAFLEKLAAAYARGETAHLGVFVPGYGKTITAIAAFLVARTLGLADRLVVFVPRGNLRDQYADGRALARLFDDLGAPPLTFCVADGNRVFLKNLATQIIITTYQYAAGDRGNDALLKYTAQGRCLFVFDEVHHLSDDGTWAQKLAAFPHAASLALSGTPMRSDNKTLFGVPFESRAGENGEDEQFYVALHEVTLRDAHAEGGILKRVEAHVVDYRLKMVRADTGEEVELSLSGLREIAPSAREVDVYLARRMLRFHDVYLDTLLRPAFARFDEKRAALAAEMRALGRGPGAYRDHQLLVIAMSNRHAAAVLDFVRARFPGLTAARIGQDLPAADCARDLAAYREGRLDVMVQVDMIGEGTDIKPISVIVKADLVRAVSKTLQQVFRGMRHYEAWPDAANVCDLYAANDSDVVGVLEWIASEQQAGLKRRAERIARDAAAPARAPEHSRWELAGVEHARMKSHALEMASGPNAPLHLREMPARTLDVGAREKALRKTCADLANELVHALAATNRPADVRDVHARAKQVVGRAQAAQSVAELEAKRRWLERCLHVRRLL